VRNSGKKKVLSRIVFGLAVLIGIYGTLIEPEMVETRHLWVNKYGSDKKILEGKIAIHISDLHISDIGPRETKVLKIIEAADPDFIFLTGDYVRWEGNYEPALTFISRLKAKVGVWAVMGDYDYSNSRNSCLFCHEQGTGNPTKRHKVHFLRNSRERINFSERYFWIVGLDGEIEEELKSEEILNPPGRNEPVIVLSHSPLAFDGISDNRKLIMLSGDTHGGQIPLPSWLWGILGYDKCARYNQGLFSKGMKKMYVNRGIGTSHIPFRFFRRPEITVLHF
jgi:uncharacterized protein